MLGVESLWPLEQIRTSCCIANGDTGSDMLMEKPIGAHGKHFPISPCMGRGQPDGIVFRYTVLGKNNSYLQIGG